MFSDLRYAFRQLIKSPGFTLVALLTLALGIGLNTAMFNIVNSMVLQPLKFPDSHRLFRLERMSKGQASGGHRPAHFVEIAREGTEVAEFVCSRPWSFTLASPDRPPAVLGSLRASPGYFRVLGLTMERGREFRPEEDQPGHDRVIILSRKFWQSHFAADPDIVGKKIRLDGLPNEIIGVAPEAASDPRTVGSPEIYRPLALNAAEISDQVDHAYSIIGRYRPGVTPAHAATRLSTIGDALALSDPTDYAGRTLQAESLNPKLRGTGRQVILMLIGLSGFVLIIACANLANLLLARAIAQAKEFSIRGALGASLAQLIRPLIAECSLLAVGGGGLGILVSLWTNEWLGRQFSAAGSDVTFVLDWRLLLFAFAASLGTALFFGVAPAWMISKTRLNDSLKSGARGSSGGRSHQRFRSVLIVGQFALALTLLSGAVFFVRGVNQLMRRDAGWQSEPLVSGILSLPSSRYDGTEKMMQFYEKVQERISTLPGVAAVAISYQIPAFRFPSGSGFVVEGQPVPKTGEEFGAPINGVTGGYFNTVGTRLVRGRDFKSTDRESSPRVIIVSETMARTLFPGSDPIGRRIAYSNEKNPNWLEIVGIAEDVKFINLGRFSPAAQAYIPLAQSTWSYVALIVRAAGPPATLIDPIRRAVGEIDPDMAIKELSPVPRFIQRSLQDVRAINQLLVAFAVLGLFLAALGIYGVISRLVAQRTNEIGIRMALGAQVNQVVRLVLATGVRLALIGAVLGIVGAVALFRFMISAMPEIATSGPLGITAATATLLMVALIACYLPARGAAKVDPVIALRAE